MHVTKSELAQELHVTKGRVSQFIARGLPVLADGSVDLWEAARWVLDNVDVGGDSGSAARSNAAELCDLFQRQACRKFLAKGECS